MTTNKFGLADGTVFILDCDKEKDPVKARKDKLTFLLSVNLETVPRDKRWTTDAVRALATCLIPTYGEKNKRLTKDMLIEGLKNVQEAERLARLSVYAELLQQHDDNLDFERDVNTFMNMLGDDNIALETLATGALEMVEKRHHTTASVIKFGIPTFKKTVRLHPKAREIDEERLESALKTLSSLKTQENKEISKEYAKKVADDAKNRIETYPSYLYEHTLKVLSNPSEFHWKDISIAMSFATGRRMAEIHTNFTVFSEVEGEEYQISFYGQRKKKPEKVKEYIIPTVVPAKMVMAGWEALKDMGRTYDDARKVNNLLNKGLNKELPVRLRNLYNKANIEIYHDIRCLYGLVMESKKPYEYTTNAWYSYLLGHNEEDLSTSNSYQAFVTRETFDPVDNHPTYTNRDERRGKVAPEQEPEVVDYAAEWEAFDNLSATE